ncbi:family 16 glycosylhydrolase [Telmatospirillum sp. J64-1]|uniref:glycoside hydrolase family 16 protein n=1 Tax=Telmatospirillum sp. J64-1 TaxID=2502183 RepID=UPI00115CB52A|nr:glycoside hydrolase family 16 protein [Telmatospirillum sp. J64-1]
MFRTSMTRRAFMASAAAAGLTAVSGHAAARPPRPGYRLVFEDHFDDPDLTRINEHGIRGRNGGTGWRSRYRHDRWTVINEEKQIYVDPDFAGRAGWPLGLQPFHIADSVLRISAMPTPRDLLPHLDGARYISGCITTENSFWQKYGWFEMRARMPLGRGFWPAFWMMSKHGGWPPEIDIFEGSGIRPREVHQGVIGMDDTGEQGWVDIGGDISRFHVYACEWTPERISFFVDGRETFRQPNLVHEEMYLLANLALGSHDPYWIPDPDETTPFPGVFEIDYVRAFARDATDERRS